MKLRSEHDWEIKEFSEKIWNSKIDTYLVCRKCGYVKTYLTLAFDKTLSCDNIQMQTAFE